MLYRLSSGSLLPRYLLLPSVFYTISLLLFFFKPTWEHFNNIVLNFNSRSEKWCQFLGSLKRVCLGLGCTSENTTQTFFFLRSPVIRGAPKILGPYVPKLFSAGVTRNIFSRSSLLINYHYLAFNYFINLNRRFVSRKKKKKNRVTSYKPINSFLSCIVLFVFYMQRDIDGCVHIISPVESFSLAWACGDSGTGGGPPDGSRKDILCSRPSNRVRRERNK